MHAGFEVAIAGEHGSDDDVFAFDDVFNAGIKRA